MPTEDGARPEPAVSVIVVALCGGELLERCLEALAGQRGAPPYEVLVAHAADLGGVERLRAAHPEVCFVVHGSACAPPELSAFALAAARGRRLLMIEDHCIPDVDWMRCLVDRLDAGCAAAGGRVEIEAGATAVDFAFYYFDFYRYAAPVASGPAASLSHCNVGYRRAVLAETDALERPDFHETGVHGMLRRLPGGLWLDPAAKVTMARRVALGPALVERYELGRIFAAGRLDFEPPARRWFYALFAPALPPLLLARMAAKALRSRRLLTPFLRSLPALVPMVLWWSCGEWVGYLTRRPSRRLRLAPQVTRR